MNNLDSPLSHFFKNDFQIMLVILCYFVNVYLSIYFGEIFLCFKFNIFLCSKLNISLLLNLATFQHYEICLLFVKFIYIYIYIYIYIALHFILHTHLLHEVKRVK